ncbi:MULTISPECIES: cytochrome C oxidase subunit IV family protein [unclassified Bradyrhizobium]|uniref:cytochrome C oxidase subunit IV family protein n=1 Tax=unclassified Bradyrhizobium TaxID=2631580 RepID=UPI0028E34D3B|nr:MULTISPECIES: cytochrome C oxidase subunit IV family protein [unclassified Bradyrhizobium]
MVRDRLTLAWLTLLSLAIATLAASLLLPNRWLADALVLSLALAKGRVIVLDFLGLRHAPALWRGLLTSWLVGLVTFAGLAVALRALV